MTIFVENTSDHYLYFKSHYGAAHVIAPGGKVELIPGEYKAAAIGKEAGQDLYPDSASVKEAHRWHETTINNVGKKTLVFQPFPVKLPPTIIKPGQTEALHYVRYKVHTE